MVALFGGRVKKLKLHRKTSSCIFFEKSLIDLVLVQLEADASSRHTAISRKVVGKMCTRQSRKVTCIGYDKYTVTDTAAVEPTSVVFL